MFKRRYFLVTLLAIVCCGVAAKRHRRRSSNAAQPYLSIDAYGNCQANDASGQRHITGRCTRYANCPSARYDWDVQRKEPFTCYYTTYENFVCCPDVSLYTTAPSYHLPVTTLGTPQLSMRHGQPAQRRSEQECSSSYFPRRNRHRSKRSDDDVIEKLNITKTGVVGGLRTYDNEYPYMCALGWRSKLKISYNCGCVLIAKKFILTAAHCASIGGAEPRVVRLGGGNLDHPRAEQIRIKRIIQHPDYNPQLSYNDIAIIKLARNSRETPACIWSEYSLPQPQLTALGYGQTRFAGPSSNTLLQVFLNVVSNQECGNFYKIDQNLPRGLLPGQLCAGDPNNRMDTCQGDSGGPLLMKVFNYNQYIPYIVGVTSFGEGCASGTPSVYTRLASYIDWIEEVVW